MFNIEETKKMIEVMQAYVEGKEIQCALITGKDQPNWRDFREDIFPKWAWDVTMYRIKPVAIPLHRRYLWGLNNDGGTMVSVVTKDNYDTAQYKPEEVSNFISWIDTEWQGEE